jgi:hypothetical protein
VMINNNEPVTQPLVPITVALDSQPQVIKFNRFLHTFLGI